MKIFITIFFISFLKYKFEFYRKVYEISYEYFFVFSMFNYNPLYSAFLYFFFFSIFSFAQFNWKFTSQVFNFQFIQPKKKKKMNCTLVLCAHDPLGFVHPCIFVSALNKTSEYYLMILKM